MQDSHRTFKRVAAQTASNLRVNFGTFLRQWGLKDFLIDEEERSDVPQEIAARALSGLCTGDLLTRDRLVFLTVVEFLDETIGAPQQDPEGVQRLRSLAHILRSVGTYEAFLQWARSWYS
jgi:hypothetical protein